MDNALKKIPVKNPLPEFGQRVLIIGKTGSGKTSFAVSMLNFLPFSPFVIYDTKDEPDNPFEKLPKSIVVDNPQARDEALDDQDIDFVIFRPHAGITTNPFAMDELLADHYDNLPEVGAYIDEAYAFHQNGRACGRGLNSLLTRGRTRGITTILSTQRPSFISKFCYSEADKFYIFYLGHEDDRKTVGKFVPGYEEVELPPKYHFHYTDGDLLLPQLFKPVPLVKQKKIPHNETIPIDELKASPRLKDEKIKRLVKWI